MQSDNVLCLRLAVTFTNAGADCWPLDYRQVRNGSSLQRLTPRLFSSVVIWLLVNFTMPGMCSVPGCKGYKKARSRGVVFHSLPTRDPGRCRKWLKAIQNPKFDENTPASKYGNIRVCSQHFKAEDYEPDIQAELMKTTPRKTLKSHVIPSVFSGRQQEDLSTSLPGDDRSRAEENAPSTAAQASTSVVSGSSVDSVLTSTASGTPSTSSQFPPPAELEVSSVDHLSDSFHRNTELSSTAMPKSDKNTEEDWSHSETIVNDSCLMELFKKCQTCGQPITKRKVSHCGAQKKVRWSCLGGHRGMWMSSPHLWEAFPEIHLLAALSVFFSGGTFTHFTKWAKHLHLHFMGHKTFFEIQKAYLNPELKQMSKSEQERVFAKGVHQQPAGTPLHISDPLKKIKAILRRREKGSLSSSSSHEKRSSISLTTTGTSMQESTAPSRPASTSERSDLDGDIENETVETAELRAPGADDNADEHVYVPTLPQRSTKSQLLLECKEEELQPWQKETSHVHLKEEDVGELSHNQTECKPDPDQWDCKLEPEQMDCKPEPVQWNCKPEPSLLHRNAASASPPELTTQNPQGVIFNNQAFIVVSPHLTSNAEFSGSLGTQCCAGNSLTILPAVQQQPLQKVTTPTVKLEAHDTVITSEVHEISNNPVLLSSVQSPAISSVHLQSTQSNSQTLNVPFTVLKLESTGT